MRMMPKPSVALAKLHDLEALTRWANTEEGREIRANMAHRGMNFAPTAEDVLALLPEEQAAELRTDLGMEE